MKNVYAKYCLMVAALALHGCANDPKVISFSSTENGDNHCDIADQLSLVKSISDLSVVALKFPDDSLFDISMKTETPLKIKNQKEISMNVDMGNLKEGKIKNYELDGENCFVHIFHKENISGSRYYYYQTAVRFKAESLVRIDLTLGGPEEERQTITYKIYAVVNNVPSYVGYPTVYTDMPKGLISEIDVTKIPLS